MCSVVKFASKIIAAKSRVIAAILIVLVLLPVNATQAYVVSDGINQITQSAYLLVERGLNIINKRTQDELIALAQNENDKHVDKFKLCPRRLVLYVGEAHTLVPTPLNRNKDVVHGVNPIWSSNNPAVAEVTSWGEVNAISPGTAVILVEVGAAMATVGVIVKEGVRIPQTDEEWDEENKNDWGAFEKRGHDDIVT